MKRVFIFTAAAVLAIVPAAVGVAGNSSQASLVPVSGPSPALTQDDEVGPGGPRPAGRGR